MRQADGMHGSMLLQQAASQDADGWRVWTSVASAIIAAFALLVAFSNRKTAKKALRLSERQEERRAARVDLSLTDGISWRPAGGGCRWIGMQVLAVNPTDRDGSLVAADLHVTYTLASGDAVVVKVPHGAGGVTLPEGITALDIPTRLQANGAVTGWLMFKLDDALIGDGTIERYDAVIRDSRGPMEAVQAWVLREIVNGEAS
jgi:hypothetical protein